MNILGNIPNRKKGARLQVYHAEDLSERDFYRNHVLLNKPCLIKGAVKSWQATKKWRDPFYLSSRLENPQVSLYHHSNYLHLERMAKTEQKVGFSDAITQFATNRDGILSVPSILCDEAGPFAPLLDDIGEFAFIRDLPKPLYYSERRFFMYCGAGTAWHYHQTDETLMCQIKGSKLVGLLDPMIPQFARIERDLMTYKYLEGDACFADYHADVRPLEVIVEEGDALYIPPFWWHGVEPTDASFGITMAQCWLSPQHKLAAFEAPALRKVWHASLTGIGMPRKLLLRNLVQASLARLWFKMTQSPHNGIL